jgi:hypothetical protein
LYVGDFRINLYRDRYLDYITSCIVWQCLSGRW